MLGQCDAGFHQACGISRHHPSFLDSEICAIDLSRSAASSITIPRFMTFPLRSLLLAIGGGRGRNLQILITAQLVSRSAHAPRRWRRET